jgi:tRNA A37 methylthiotransferase MiaB
MKRRYTIEYYDLLLDSFRRSVPNLAASTDIIVGFPGETESDFQATYDYLAKTRYDSAFLFKYSPRPGTKSYEWGDPLSEEEKLRRLQAVIHLQEKISFEKNQEWVGKTVEILAEGPSRKSSSVDGTAFLSPLPGKNTAALASSVPLTKGDTRPDLSGRAGGQSHPVWFGKSPQFKTVVFKPTGEIKPGDKISAPISRATSHTLFGAGVKNEKDSR